MERPECEEVEMSQMARNRERRERNHMGKWVTLSGPSSIRTGWHIGFRDPMIVRTILLVFDGTIDGSDTPS